MQLKQSDIVNKVALEKGLDVELLQSISDSVFQEIARKIKKPDNLIIYVKGLGKIYARKKKTLDGIEKMNNSLKSPKTYSNEERTIEYRTSLEFLINTYEEFTKEKNQYRNANNNNTND